MTILINMILAGTAPAGQSTEDLAKAAQNPIAAMISLPFQNNTNFKVGPEEKTQNVLNIQPVWPIDLSTDLNLITRTIVPVISQPATQMGQERTNGIGDVQFSAFFSPKLPTANGWIWGGGFIAQLDTSSNEVLGTGKWKWGLGPTAVVLKMDGQWVYGALINNAWSIAGDDNRADVNAMLANRSSITIYRTIRGVTLRSHRSSQPTGKQAMMTAVPFHWAWVSARYYSGVSNRLICRPAHITM